MTNREKIIELREKGKTYKEIAADLGLAVGTVKCICSREKNKDNTAFCLYCGKPLKLIKGKKAKRFCCDKCRHKWWLEHNDLLKRKTYVESTCAFCGKTFRTYGNRQRKYCCQDCYQRSRRGKNNE